MTVAELRELLAALPGDGPVLLGRGNPRHGLNVVASVAIARRQVHAAGFWWVDPDPCCVAGMDDGPPVVALLVCAADRDPPPSDDDGE